MFEKNSKIIFPIAGGILLAVFLIGLIVFVPTYQANLHRAELRARAEKLKETAPSDEARFQVDRDSFLMEKELGAYENATRTTLAQIAGGLFLILGAYFAWRNIRAREEGNVTERFSKAVEMLASEQIDVCVGAIYALERIANDSYKDHWTVMEVLTAFIRENSLLLLEEEDAEEEEEAAEAETENTARKKSGKTKKSRPAKKRTKEVTKLSTDMQAALTVIGRRKWWYKETFNQRLDFSGSFLPKANLQYARLDRANFNNVQMPGAMFIMTKLKGASLIEANFEKANFEGADLSQSFLAGTNITGASLYRANLDAAFLGFEGLRPVIGLTREQLQFAHWSEKTKLPEEFSNLKKTKIDDR